MCGWEKHSGCIFVAVTCDAHRSETLLRKEHHERDAHGGSLKS